MPLAPRVLVVSFDDVLLSATSARQRVLADAMAAHSLPMATGAWTVGATFHEAAHDALTHTPAAAAMAVADPTLVELVAFDAARRWREVLRDVLSIDLRVAALMHRAVARGGRVVVRADSDRREVDALLTSSGLEQLVAFARCADDPAVRSAVPDVEPSTIPRAAHRRTFERSWAAIQARLLRWQLAPSHSRLLERAELRARARILLHDPARAPHHERTRLP